MEKLKYAIDFAKKHHALHFRKDNKTPYVFHPLKVLKLLKGLVHDEDILVAAVLHDVIEDTKVELKEVRLLFGYKVAKLIKETMRTDDNHYQVRTKEGLIIKLADMLHNATDNPSDLWVQKRIDMINGGILK